MQVRLPRRSRLVEAADGSVITFSAHVRLDSEVDLEYYQNQGILQTVLRKMASGAM